MGPATDKHQAPTHQLKLYVRAVIESEAWPTVMQLKRKPGGNKSVQIMSVGPEMARQGIKFFYIGFHMEKQ